LGFPIGEFNLRVLVRNDPKTSKLRKIRASIWHFLEPNCARIVCKIISINFASAGAQAKRQEGKQVEKSQEVYISRTRGETPAVRFQPNLTGVFVSPMQSKCRVLLL